MRLLTRIRRHFEYLDAVIELGNELRERESAPCEWCDTEVLPLEGVRFREFAWCNQTCKVAYDRWDMEQY